MAGSVISASVLASGFSSASSIPGGFGSSSNYSNSFSDNSYFQPSIGLYVAYCLFINNLVFLTLCFFSNRPASPNPQRKQQAPMNPPTNSFNTREPPPPPLRPSPVPTAFGGNASTLPAPMMPQ